MNNELNPVGWFEIPTIDMARAKQFYESVFEIQMELHNLDGLEMAWFPMIENAMGATGSLVKEPSYKVSDCGIVIYFTAPDINATLGRVKQNGGEVLQEKTPIGEYGFIAYIKDSEGNRIGLHSRE